MLSKALLPEKREGCSRDEFRDTTVPPAVVSAELAHRRRARTAVSLVEFPDFFCSVSGDGTWLLRSLRDLCFEGLWCLPFCASANSP